MNTLANLFSSEKEMAYGKGIDFTITASINLQSLVRKKDFSYRDSELIFNYLLEQSEYTPFCTYLRRYIYKHNNMSGPFETVPNSTYYEVLKDCFHETKTPSSFHKTSTTFKVLSNGWLNASTVNRESIFLLGFALKMPVEDVSLFLTRAICDNDFNFNDPEEVIFWHCYRNNLSANHAKGMIDEFNKKYADPSNVNINSFSYEDISSSFSTRRHIKWNGELTITTSERNYIGDTDQDIMDYLLILRLRNRKYKYSLTAFTQFHELLAKAKELLKKERHDEMLMEAEFIIPRKTIEVENIRDADIEKALYSGVPLVSGNLKNIAYSSLGKSFAQHRLTRQRISRLVSGKAAVSRFDLITINFLVFSKSEFSNPITRYKSFVVDTDSVLKKCFMGPLNVSNLYEAFILCCLLTEDPIYSFSDVWEMAYDQSSESD